MSTKAYMVNREKGWKRVITRWIEVDVFFYEDRVRASLPGRGEITMYGGTARLWNELISRNLVRTSLEQLQA